MSKKKAKAKKPKKTTSKKRSAVRKKKPTIKKTTGKTTKKKILKKKPVLKKRPPTSKAKKTKASSASTSIGVVIGKITHYYPHVNAAVLKVKSPLKIGDRIRIKGHTTDFTETVSSIQINRQPISEAKKDDEIGLLVGSRVRGGDIVYKI